MERGRGRRSLANILPTSREEETRVGEPSRRLSGRGAMLQKLISEVRASAAGSEVESTASASVKSVASTSEIKSAPSASEGGRAVSSEFPPPTSMGRGFLAHLAHQMKSRASMSATSECQESETMAIEDEMKNISLDTEESIIKRGEAGDKINVTTNYVILKTSPDKSVYEYFVSFEPEIDSVGCRSKLVNVHFKSRRGIKCYDGGNRLYLPEKVTNDKIVIDTKHPNDNSDVQITVLYKRKMTLKECSTLYNILFHNCAKVLRYARLGRENYDYQQSHRIPQHKLEVWPGYVTSVKEFEGGILLVCDIKHRVLRTETAYDVLSTAYRLDPNNFRNVAAKELLGQCVLTRYNNNLYRIDDINWDQTPMSTFKLLSGEDISFQEYYKRQYNINIIDTKQPLLISKAKTKSKDKGIQLICLVPEICHMTGLTDKMKNDIRVMKEISNYTRITPSQRQFAFKKFLGNILNNPHAQEMLSDWGLTICNEPLQLDGRILPTEQLIFRNKKNVYPSENKFWLSVIPKCQVYRNIDLKFWALLHTHRDTNLANKFKEMIKKVGPGLGIDIFEPKIISLRNDRIDSFIEGLKDAVSSEVQAVVCLCPTARTDRYSAIKKFCCREYPIASQVINTSTIARENKMHSVVQNVALQINHKLGGAAWAVRIPLKNCMVCGIDAYHEKDCNSVGAFVASIDEEFTQWFSRTCMQQPNQELLDGLVYSLTAALKKYLTINRVLPERIVIFRDGVSDGMLSYVQNHEIQQFLDAFALVSRDYKPKLSFVIVQKRINTKIYQMMDSSKTEDNPKSGCVVDHTITARNLYDFYLVSQYVTSGTVTPSHYIVLYDTSGLKPDLMQRLTYKFCHLYYNWSGTIRVPAPCQYAHKLAYLVGQNLKGQPSELLESTLFYL